MPGSPVAKPFVVLLSKVKDQDQEPLDKQHYIDLFTQAGAGKSGMYDYWDDISHGTISLEGTEVFGWFTLKEEKADYAKLSRQAKIDTVIDQSKIDVSKYVGVVVITNVDYEVGASGNRTIHGPNSSNVRTVGHEMGHILGLGHSFDDGWKTCSGASWGKPGEYCDHWCLMGTGAYALDTPHTFGPLGPGLNAVQLDRLGALDSSRVWSLSTTGNLLKPETVQLAALGHAGAKGYLAIKIPYYEAGGWNHYYVELRTKDAWDKGIPRSTVLVHQVRHNDSNRPRLVTVDQSGDKQLIAGETFADEKLNLFVRVLTIELLKHQAVVHIGPVPGVSIMSDTHALNPEYHGQDTLEYSLGSYCPPKTIHFATLSQDPVSEAYATTHEIEKVDDWRWTLEGTPLVSGQISLTTSAYFPKKPSLPGYEGEWTSVTKTITLEVSVSGSKVRLASSRHDGVFSLTLAVQARDNLGTIFTDVVELTFAGIVLEVDQEGYQYAEGCWNMVMKRYFDDTAKTVPVGFPRLRIPEPDPRREGPADGILPARVAIEPFISMDQQPDAFNRLSWQPTRRPPLGKRRARPHRETGEADSE